LITHKSEWYCRTVHCF